MRRLTVDQIVIAMVLAILAPLGLIGIAQALASRDYADQLISQRMVTSALVTAEARREPFTLAENMLSALSRSPNVVSANDRCPLIFKQALLGQSAIINLARVDANGIVKCSAIPFKGVVQTNDLAWYKEGLSATGLTVSAPIVGRVTKRRVLGAMIPLRGANGKNDGAVTAAIDASWLENQPVDGSLSHMAAAFVTDKKGKILLSTGRSDLPSFDIPGSFGKAASIIASDGSQWVYASSPLFKRDLHVVYAEMQRPLFSPLQSQLRVNLILPVLAILGACAAIWFAMRFFVTRWLNRLSRVTEAIGRGEYGKNTQSFASAPRDISELSDHLQLMSDAIEERDTRLRASADRNAAMAREVNHRVKNNLQIIISLIELQSAQVPQGPTRAALDATRMRASVIALIQRVLYETDGSGEAGLVNLGRLMRELSSQAQNEQGANITLSCVCDDVTIPIDRAMPIALFAVEAIYSACEAIGTDTGHVALHCACRPGIDDQFITIESTPDGGTRPDLKSMTVMLMQAYASQLGGQFTTEVTADKHRIVRLSFPALQPGQQRVLEATA